MLGLPKKPAIHFNGNDFNLLINNVVYTYEQILDLIKKDEIKMSRTITMTDREFELFKANVLERHKMTREEAENIVLEVTDGNPMFAKKSVELWEKMGFIKFDEPKPKYVFFPHPDNKYAIEHGKDCKDNVAVLESDVVSTMAAYGYNVEKRK